MAMLNNQRVCSPCLNHLHYTWVLSCLDMSRPAMLFRLEQTLRRRAFQGLEAARPPCALASWVPGSKNTLDVWLCLIKIQPFIIVILIIMIMIIYIYNIERERYLKNRVYILYKYSIGIGICHIICTCISHLSTSRRLSCSRLTFFMQWLRRKSPA
jgi:hypothetical protein